MNNQETSGRATSEPPHHSVTLELTVPNTPGDLYLISMGCGFLFGDYDVTYNWSVKNKTDNEVLNSGSLKPSDPDLPEETPPLHQVQWLKEQPVKKILPWPQGEYFGCPYEADPFCRFHLSLTYKITDDLRSKVLEFKITDPSETNTKALTIQVGITTSCYPS